MTLTSISTALTPAVDRSVSDPGRSFMLFVALYYIMNQDQAGRKQTMPSRLETVLSVPLPCTSSPFMCRLCDLDRLKR